MHVIRFYTREMNFQFNYSTFSRFKCIYFILNLCVAFSENVSSFALMHTYTHLPKDITLGNRLDEEKRVLR